MGEDFLCELRNFDGEHPILIENTFGTVELLKPGFGTTIEMGKAPSAPYLWSKEKVDRAVKTILIDP